MWCTIEETRIYDIAFVEGLRMTHYYSPLLAGMLGKVRARITQSFGSLLAMSRRLEVEMQRIESRWKEVGEERHKESALRQAAQLRAEQLQAKLSMLEARHLSQRKEPSKADEKRGASSVQPKPRASQCLLSPNPPSACASLTLSSCVED